MKHLIILIACGALSCGPTTVGEKGSAPANSGYTYTPGGGMEQGSSDAAVQQAFDRLLPALCDYYDSCPDDPFQDCETELRDLLGDGLSDGCWVVDQARVTQCETELQGATCSSLDSEGPSICEDAIHQCGCLAGYVEAYYDGEFQCFPPCGNDGTCNADLQCVDGACLPQEEGACPQGTVEAEVNGERGCFDECDAGSCAAGFSCHSGLCIADG